MEKLKDLVFREEYTCNLKIGSIPAEGIFRYMKDFNVRIEKKEDTTSFSLYTLSRPLYKFTVYLRNLSNIIQSSPCVYYIIIYNRPSLYELVQVMSTETWQQCDYSIFNPDTDYISSLVYPMTLVFKLEFFDYCEDFDKFIEYSGNCKIDALDMVDIEFNDNPLPNYTEYFNWIEAWDTKYMILVLLTNCQMNINDLTPENIRLINSCSNSTSILEEIYYNYEEFSKDLFNQYDINGVSPERNKIPNPNHISVRKVRFTPSTLIFEPPEIDVSNRVTRKFPFPDYYIRVSIEEENHEKRIWSNCPEILKKFKGYLKHLEIAGRHYEFLGFSNSQMKNHSLWMVARESGYTADDIRSYLGDFSRCKNNSKYASRLGLCFSGTYFTIEMNRKKIPDIERNGYCFTDGIGRISPQCMENAKEKLGILQSQIICALQIRIGGCKGVLALYNDCEEVEVRPSMDKFDSNEKALEVCSFSAYRSGYLNRQIILLLNGRGVPDEVFMRIQENMIKELEQSVENEQEALKLLISHEKDPGIPCLKYMLMNNVKLNEEPYLQRMITALYQSKVSDIKNKARILAPDSLILLGIVDEYAILEYGEVFIFPSKNNRPIIGEVIVAKNPCLHPGDIRVLIAKDIPRLYYLKDVLIFPQKGNRPHPNECSGSDLDGDMYFVSWNPELIPTIKYEEPMNYNAPPEIREEPSIDGVIDFFVKFMESENLGNIANTHLAQADANGIYNDQVIILAELHSMAVDYAKTGKPAIIPPTCRVKKWPDFMEKVEKNTYTSTHVLGKMYRAITSKDIKTFIPLLDERYLQNGYQAFINIARGLYKSYERELKRYMRQYDTENEFYFLTFQPGSKLGKKTKVDNKLKMQEFVQELINNTLVEFHSLVDTYEEKRLLASACYWISYSREKDRKQKFIRKFISFPWIFYEFLI